MEPLLHFVIPFIALTMLGVDLRKALLLGLLGVLPDLDALFLIHRSMSHSLVVLALVWTPVLISIRVRAPHLWQMGLLGLLVLFSHPMMDVVQSHTPILWPLYGQSIYLKLAFNVLWGSEVGFNPRTELSMVPTNFRPVNGFDYPLFTGEGLIISIILLLPVILPLIRGRVLSEDVKSANH
jgi:membrane-bound metal-dependent hydrolase YbcI (DUF457 family)